MQIDLDALERYSRLIVDGPHDHLPQSFVKAHENTLALIAKVRELEQQRDTARGVPEALTVSMAPHSQYAKGWNACRAAMLAAAPTPPDGDAERHLRDAKWFVQQNADMAASKGEGA